MKHDQLGVMAVLIGYGKQVPCGKVIPVSQSRSTFYCLSKKEASLESDQLSFRTLSCFLCVTRFHCHCGILRNYPDNGAHDYNKLHNVTSKYSFSA